MFILHKVASTQTGSFDIKMLPIIFFIGILISVGNFLIIKAYSIGAPQSGFTSIFYPLLILYGIIFGLLFWHEKLNVYQSLGIILSIIGTLLVVYFKK
jgi:drug/metabolite transporter (DMT)-like permease